MISHFDGIFSCCSEVGISANQHSTSSWFIPPWDPRGKAEVRAIESNCRFGGCNIPQDVEILINADDTPSCVSINFRKLCIIRCDFDARTVVWIPVFRHSKQFLKKRFPKEVNATPLSEDVRIRVLYRDPLHDFAFVALLTDDGSIPTDLPEEITLDPDSALPNTEIHRVSNESGLGGNIGQGYIGTDCNPPALTGWSRDDINIEYIALSMVTQGGSSGSVAVNREGKGVSLTCSSNLLNCYMLPLDLPLRALTKLQRGERVTRGTLQVKWELKTLNDCKRRGLNQEWSDKFEACGVKSLVCARVVLPNGPADGKVRWGWRPWRIS